MKNHNYYPDENLTGSEEEYIINRLQINTTGYHFNWRELQAFKRLIIMNAKLEERRTEQSEFFNALGWEVIDLLIDEIIELKKEL